MLALALMGLLPAGARVKGEAWLRPGIAIGGGRGKPRRIEALRVRIDPPGIWPRAGSEKEWRVVRGGEIAMVFQEPMTSLNPVMRIGAQIEEAIRAHESGLAAGDVKRKGPRRRGGARPSRSRKRAAEQFPHQLSGGLLRARHDVGMALAAGPRVLIADEPTTALSTSPCKSKSSICLTSFGAGCGLECFLSPTILELSPKSRIASPRFTRVASLK